jgi:hypothetical protein
MLDGFLPKDYPDFKEHGNPPCAESYPDAFFSEDNEEIRYTRSDGKEYSKVVSSYRYEKEAKAICATCPYKMQCLEYALKDPSLQGIWGGTTERTRRTIRQNAKRTQLTISTIK